MTGYLLDTNVISELTRDIPDSRVVDFLAERDEVWVSSVLIHEVEYGVRLLPQGIRRNRLSTMQAAILSAYAHRVLPLDRAGAEWAAEFRVNARRSGRTVDLVDALIAGIARAHDLAVATRNIADFPALQRRGRQSLDFSVTTLTESDVEQVALDWLASVGWKVAHGPDIAPDRSGAERSDYGEVVLAKRLRDALAELNPHLPAEALGDAFRKLTRPEGATLEARNRAFHRMLVEGVTVEYRADEGAIRGAQVQVIDFDEPASNDWLAVNQFTVTENQHTRRPDVVLFVNGLPLGIIELKNPADEDATLWTAWQQLQTYKAELPSLFSMNDVLMVSDGVQARIGTLTAGREWFKPWRTITGERLAGTHLTELQVMLEGSCEPERFLSLVRDFIVFEDDGSGSLVKKIAGYHQFHAVQVAVAETLRAAELQIADERGRYEAGRQPGGDPGDRRIGVVWHTQGSGKSLTMAFYAGRIIREPAMQNPTVVVLTDRNDLDDQLFGTFSRCQHLLRPAAGAGREPSRPAPQALGGCRRRGIHHHPEVLPRRKGR